MKRQFGQRWGAQIMRFLAILCLLLSLVSGNATTLQMNLAFFLANPTTNRSITLQPISIFPGNLIFLTSDTNGIAYLSNAPLGLINGVIQAPPGRINFQVNITSQNLGVIDASNCIANGVGPTYPAGQVSWSIVTSDQRYALNGQTSSNTFYPLYSNPSNYVTAAVTNGLATTNYVNSQTASGASTNYVNTATNTLGTALSQQIINSTSSIPAQISAATNTPVITRLSTNVVGVIFVNGSGSASASTTNGLGIAYNISVGSQTNGQTTLVYTNPLSVVYTNMLGGLTNGLITTNQLANYATTNFANQAAQNATNGLPAGIWTLGTASQSNASAFVTPAQLTSATNGSFISASNYTYASSVNNTNNDTTVSNGVLATATARITAATNGLPASIWTLGTASQSNAAAFYLNSNPSNYQSGIQVTNTLNSVLGTASNTAAALISIANQATLYAITNAIANSKYYNLITTNQAIQVTGFGSTVVNTIFFIQSQNLYIAPSGASYFYDGSNWNLYTPSTGTLYQLGGVSPVGNTYTVVGGSAPAGFSYFTNVPISTYTLTQITNIVQSAQVGGVVSGAVTNQVFSAAGTNAIIAIVGTNGGGSSLGFTNAGGVTQGYLTNQLFSQLGSNVISSIAVAFVTNGAAATNVYVAAGNAGITIVTNSASSWTFFGTPYRFSNTNAALGFYTNAFNIALGTNVPSGGGGTTYNFFNTNTPAGTVATNGVFVGIGTNASASGIAINNGFGTNTLINQLTVAGTNGQSVILTADQNANLNIGAGVVLNGTGTSGISRAFTSTFGTNNVLASATLMGDWFTNINSSAIINSLGIYHQDSGSYSVPIYLYRVVSGTLNTLLASGTVGMTSGNASTYVYTSITPVSLISNQTYAVVFSNTTSATFLITSGGVFDTNIASSLGSVIAAGGATNFTATALSGSSSVYGPATFLFTTNTSGKATLTVQANSNPTISGNTNSSELAVDTGIHMGGLVTAPSGIIQGIGTANVVNSGNNEAQSYTLNGQPLNFLGTLVATSLLVTNSGTGFPYTNFNGTYLFNMASNYWTNVISGYQIVQLGNTNNAQAYADYLNPANANPASMMVTNLATYTNGSTSLVFLKYGVSLIGYWNYAISPGIDTRKQPLLSYATYTIAPNTNSGILSATNAQYATLGTNGTRVFVGQTNAYGQPSTIVDGSTPAANITYFVAPWGNDNNNGLSRVSPLANAGNASFSLATNAGNLIYLMDGVNTNMLLPGVQTTVNLQPGVSWYQEPGSVLVMSNSVLGILTEHFRINGNANYNNLNIRFIDTNRDNVCVVGLSTSVPSTWVTNLVINNMVLNSDSGGFHFEGGGLNKVYSLVLNNPIITANDHCFEMKSIQNANVILNNPTFIVTNSVGYAYENYNSNQPAKPIRAFEIFLGANSHLTINGGSVHFSDSIWSNNQASCAFYVDGLLTNMVTANSLIIYHDGVTNPASFDIISSYPGLSNSSSNTMAFSGVVRADGTPLTETNATGVSALIAGINANVTQQYGTYVSQTKSNLSLVTPSATFPIMTNGVVVGYGGPVTVGTITPTNGGIVRVFGTTNTAGVAANTQMGYSFTVTTNTVLTIQDTTATNTVGFGGTNAYAAFSAPVWFTNMMNGAGLNVHSYSTNATLVSGTSLVVGFTAFADLTTNYTVTAPNDLLGVTTASKTPTNFTLNFTAATITAQTIEGGVIHK